jgi:hypothetical protein
MLQIMFLVFFGKLSTRRAVWDASDRVLGVLWKVLDKKRCMGCFRSCSWCSLEISRQEELYGMLQIVFLVFFGKLSTRRAVWALVLYGTKVVEYQ